MSRLKASNFFLKIVPYEHQTDAETCAGGKPHCGKPASPNTNTDCLRVNELIRTVVDFMAAQLNCDYKALIEKSVDFRYLKCVQNKYQRSSHSLLRIKM